MTITMYGKADCGPCQTMKPWVAAWCQEFGVAFDYQDLVEDPEALAAALAHGFRVVPAVVVTDAAGVVTYRGAGAEVTEQALEARVRPS